MSNRDRRSREEGRGQEENNKRRKIQTEVTVEVRNIRGLKGSKAAIERAEEARREEGQQTDVYIFTETMAEKEVEIKGYESRDPVQATREKTQGRASGGVQIYVRDQVEIPIQRLKTEEEPKDCVVIVIGDKRRCKATALIAYYRRPDQREEQIIQYFRKLKDLTRELTARGYRVVTAGDANAHLGLGDNMTQRPRTWRVKCGGTMQRAQDK